MRLFGIALFTAWVLAWWSSPHGEPARQTTIVGGVAIAGSDRAAFAWLELTHGMGERGGRLHVAGIDEHNRWKPLFTEDARPDTSSFRIADAGDGNFVLVREFRGEKEVGWTSSISAVRQATRTLVFEAFDGTGKREPLPTLVEVPGAGEWQIAAAGDQLAVSVQDGARYGVYLLGADGQWTEPTWSVHALVAADDGRLVRYERFAHNARVTINPGREGSWGTDLSSADCFEAAGTSTKGALSPTVGGAPNPYRWAPPDVVSVLPLRGGFARLARVGNVGCVDGMRDGQAFREKGLDLRLFAAARLAREEDGRLAVYDVREGQVAGRRLLLPERTGGEMVMEALASSQKGAESSYRYRLFGRGGKLGIPSLGTRIRPGETEVVIERYGGQRSVGAPEPGITGPISPFPLRPAMTTISATLASPFVAASYSQMVAPVRLYQADYRPLLRRLSLLPLLWFALAGLGSLRLLGRLRKLRPTSPDVPLPGGPVVVEGTLATDAEAPEGGLRLRRGRMPMRLFLEGAQVLRASQVRPRDQPRGDAVDVARGAPIVATGIAEAGSAFRAEDTVRARRGDLVIVGCTLAEARERVTARLASSIALLAGTGATVLFLALR